MISAKEFKSLSPLLGVTLSFNAIVRSFTALAAWLALQETSDWRLVAAAAPMVLNSIGYMIAARYARHVVDHHSPRYMLFFASAICVVFSLIVIAADLLGSSAHVIILALLIGSTITSMLAPFVDGAVVRNIYTRKDIVPGYAWRGAAVQTGMFGGPALCLLVYGLFGSLAGFATLLVMSIIIGILTHWTELHVIKDSHERVEKFDMIHAPLPLRQIAWASGMWNALIVAGLALVPILLVDYSKLSITQGGLVTLAGVTAALCSPYVIGKLKDGIGLYGLFAIAVFIESILIVSFGFLPSVPIGFIAYFILILSNSICSSTSNTIRALLAPADKQASANVVLGSIVHMGKLLGALSIAVGVSFISPMILAVASSLGLCALSLWIYRIDKSQKSQD